MAVHLCGQYRLIMETEIFYLSLESAGVIKLDKSGPIASIANDGEWIDPCIMNAVMGTPDFIFSRGR